MKDLASIALFALLVVCAPLVTDSGVVLNFITMALYACLLAQAWNILGGFGGQFSFGHALFFGTGAYVQAIAQLHGLNPWLALTLALAASAAVGLCVGALSVPFTGAGVGLMVPLRASTANMQFASRAGTLWLVLGMVIVALLVTAWLRHSRFGAWLQAVRDNEDAARAVGVDPFRVKLAAIAISAALMGAGGAFYVQVFQYIDPGIAYGPGTSVEALVAAIVGGMGTLWGPALGALALHLLADLTRNLFGELPGINMVIYGVVLVLIMMFMPRGVAGLRMPARGRRNAEQDQRRG